MRKVTAKLSAHCEPIKKAADNSGFFVPSI